jgi:HK97 family phage major capsid protein/HK97 family phage prohead protease
MSERLEIKAEVAIDDAGTVTGIAWPFGAPDSIGDLIEPTAFRFAGKVPMILEHDQRQVVGVWESHAVTERGLEVKGRLFVEGIEPAREARRYLRAGVMSGLSIGYSLHDHKARPEGGRVLTDLTINEISLCRRPVHPGARTTEVKSINEKDPMENEAIETAPEAKAEPILAQKAVDALKTRLDRLEAKANRPTLANDNNRAAANDNEIKAVSDDLKRTLKEQKALTISPPGTGGNLLNDTLMTQILEKIGKSNPVRLLANSIQLDTGLLKIPRLVSGVTPGSVTETATKPESTPTFEQISIEPYMMGAQVLVSRSQLEDSAINLVSWISGHIAGRFAELESAWFVNGDGTTQAEGVLTSDEVQEIKTATATLGVDDLLDLLYSVKATYQNAGSWVMNRKTARLIRGLKDSDGNLIWKRSLQLGEPGRILGQPVYMADDMPDPVAGKTPIIFGDFYRGYLITDRIAFEPSVDYAKFSENDLVQFVGRRRVGGRVVMGEALTKLKLAA